MGPGRAAGLALVLALLTVADAKGRSCEDRDGDGFFSVAGCGTDRDCNDDDAAIHPGAVELCDGRDGDCNGLVDDSPDCSRVCAAPEKFLFETEVSQDPAANSEAGYPVWVGDGWVVAYQTWWQGDCSRLSLQRLDPSGNRVGDPFVVADGFVRAAEPQLLWTGSVLVVGWTAIWEFESTCFNPYRGIHAYVQRFDRNLQPLDIPLDLGCGPSHVSDPRVEWNGTTFGLAWRQGAVVQYSAMTRDWVVTDTCGYTVSGNNGPGGHDIRWNGEWFGVSWHECRPGILCGGVEGAEIWFRRVGEVPGSPDLEPRRLTFEPESSHRTSLAWADGEWAISWSDERHAPSMHYAEVYFLRLEPDGTIVDPPGETRITCCNSEAAGIDRSSSDLVWTGEEFGLIYDEIENFGTGDVRFRRLDAAGNQVGDPLLLTPDTNRNAVRPRLAWNGSEYAAVWDDRRAGMSARQVLFARIGCECYDADEDGYTVCVGADCDDGNPLVRPGLPEACLNGIDDNCDAAIDCQDAETCPATSGPFPGEVTGLTIAPDKVTVAWQFESRSDSYDLLTGNLDALRADGGFARSTCLAWRVPGTSAVDPTTPDPGIGRYYLVRGKKDQCKLGTWGTALRNEARLTCP